MGEKIGESDLTTKRPGSGEIAARDLNRIVGKHAARDLNKDQQLKWVDVK